MHCIIRKKSDAQKALMIELTLLTLLNYVGDNFCEYRNLGHDNYKSLLLSYSDASNKFGPLEVKKVIEKSENFKVTAVAIAAIATAATLKFSDFSITFFTSNAPNL